MTNRYKLTDETITFAGKTLHRVYWNDEDRFGGWASKDAIIPQDGTAVLYDDVKIVDGVFHGGEFWGGEFHGGVFRGGEFHGGVFRGGVFYDGVFCEGEFRGGVFYDGVFRDGVFCDGVFRDGVFRGGVFCDGVFHSSPCCALRSDGYMFVSKYVAGELRIWAGCRNFSWDEAISHWDDKHRHGAESQRIIHFLKSQADAERSRDQAKGDGK